MQHRPKSLYQQDSSVKRMATCNLINGRNPRTAPLTEHTTQSNRPTRTLPKILEPGRSMFRQSSRLPLRSNTRVPGARNRTKRLGKERWRQHTLPKTEGAPGEQIYTGLVCDYFCPEEIIDFGFRLNPVLG